MNATTKVKDVLTTGEVAKICNVAPRTVSKWFDSGALHGYRIPGSKDRRIPLNQLIRFMKHHGMPLNGLMTGCTRVLIVDEEQDIVEVLEKILEDEAKYEVEVAKGGIRRGDHGGKVPSARDSAGHAPSGHRRAGGLQTREVEPRPATDEGDRDEREDDAGGRQGFAGGGLRRFPA